MKTDTERPGTETPPVFCFARRGKMIIRGDDIRRVRVYDRHNEIRLLPRRSSRRGVFADKWEEARHQAMGMAEIWLTEERLTLLEGWARDGLSRERIAGQMGISIRTFYKWQKKYPQIADAVRKGRETVDYQVEQALLDKALGGDLKAQMYWLNNRRGDKWQEHPGEKADENAEPVTVIVDG